MDSKKILFACVFFALTACSSGPSTPPEPANDKGYEDNAITHYWHPTQITADNMPDIVKAQAMLEQDLVQCGYETRDHRRWAQSNYYASNDKGHVSDNRGVDRADAPLPTSYELSECMQTRGWVRLKHYYTVPY